ncbi:fibropellin-1-like [Stylophora pistillata]|uniref:fibropellin-1-like n=1 Tax=Stylophora pistillata TaxID=50429 RepID=UPI000C04D4D8|nr:fibropellin-1-like [Stylophora pistillata]
MELHAHRQMLQTLNQPKAEKLELKSPTSDEISDLMQILRQSISDKEIHLRPRRHLENSTVNPKSIHTFRNEDVKKLGIVLRSLVCTMQCPQSVKKRRGRPGERGPPGKRGPPGPKELNSLTPFSTEEIDECVSNPCLNGGICVDQVNGYVCHCRLGYKGNNCRTDINECSSNPCLNGGSCFDLVNRYVCACHPGYAGVNCQKNINRCSSNPCLNGGTCVNQVNGYTCNCHPGYKGNNCQTDINRCSSNPCLNGGTCVNQVNGYACNCRPGYKGNNCQTDINECSSKPCLNGGTCFDRVNGYVCNCRSGYKGNNCQNAKFSGARQKQTRHEEENQIFFGNFILDKFHRLQVTVGSSSVVSNYRECAFSCLENPPCSSLNVASSPHSDGKFQCELLNEDKYSARPGQLVSSQEYHHYSIKWYFFVLFSGIKADQSDFKLDGRAGLKRGVDFREKRVSYGNFAVKRFHRLQVSVGISSVVSNYRECALSCVNAPPCSSFDVASSPRSNGKFLCELLNEDKYSARPGQLIRSQEYHHYSIKTPCSSFPCQNEAVCVPKYDENLYHCDCKPGYEGKSCETEINECSSNPCLNEGTCVDQVNGYLCNCRPGYEGANCQTDINECSSNPCLNGGTCVDQVNGYLCNCQPGYGGVKCQTNINECSRNPCLKGGTCVDQVNGYLCNCQPGYGGAKCQTNINECSSNPCLNGGTCVDQVNGYLCNCQPGYGGTKCQTNINECSSNPCLNGGTCVDQVDGYVCSCRPGYAGTNCQTSQSGGSWTEYTPYICGNSNRNKITEGVTEQECKQQCSSCAAIEYWSGGNLACFECFDKTQRYHYTNTHDGSYPPHVFVKN